MAHQLLCLYFKSKIGYNLAQHPDDSLRSLKKNRESVKSRVTCILNFAKKFKGNEVEQLESRTPLLPELLNEFFEVHYKILDLGTDGESGEDEAFDSLYHNAVAEIANKIKQIATTAEQSFKVKLPEVNLPRFNG